MINVTPNDILYDLLSTITNIFTRLLQNPIYGAPSRATVTTTQMQQKEEWAGPGEKYFRDHAVDPSPCCDPQMLPKLPPF